MNDLQKKKLEALATDLRMRVNQLDDAIRTRDLESADLAVINLRTSTYLVQAITRPAPSVAT